MHLYTNSVKIIVLPLMFAYVFQHLFGFSFQSAFGGGGKVLSQLYIIDSFYGSDHDRLSCSDVAQNTLWPKAIIKKLI